MITRTPASATSRDRGHLGVGGRPASPHRQRQRVTRGHPMHDSHVDSFGGDGFGDATFSIPRHGAERGRGRSRRRGRWRALKTKAGEHNAPRLFRVAKMLAAGSHAAEEFPTVGENGITRRDAGGFEPTRARARQRAKLLRLPVSPRQHHSGCEPLVSPKAETRTAHTPPCRAANVEASIAGSVSLQCSSYLFFARSAVAPRSWRVPSLRVKRRGGQGVRSTRRRGRRSGVRG